MEFPFREMAGAEPELNRSGCHGRWEENLTAEKLPAVERPSREKFNYRIPS